MASQNAVVIDMGTPAPAPAVGPAATATTNSKSDTLFGPNIGVLGGGPEWTESQEKSSDVLTPEIVKGWIAKSKEVSVSVFLGAWESSSARARSPPHWRRRNVLRPGSRSEQSPLLRSGVCDVAGGLPLRSGFRGVAR